MHGTNTSDAMRGVGNDPVKVQAAGGLTSWIFFGVLDLRPPLAPPAALRGLAVEARLAFFLGVTAPAPLSDEPDESASATLKTGTAKGLRNAGDGAGVGEQELARTLRRNVRGRVLPKDGGLEPGDIDTPSPVGTARSSGARGGLRRRRKAAGCRLQGM